MSEQLNEIKVDVESLYNALNRDDIDGFLDVAENFIDNGYFEWLIAQAELERDHSTKIGELHVFLQNNIKTTPENWGRHVIDVPISEMKNQAERVEELEKLQSSSKMKLLGTIHNLRNRVQELEREVEGREKFELGTTANLKILREQNKRYREAIQFYANEDNWNEKEADSGNCMTDYESKAVLDGGYKAREALESESNE